MPKSSLWRLETNSLALTIEMERAKTSHGRMQRSISTSGVSFASFYNELPAKALTVGRRGRCHLVSGMFNASAFGKQLPRVQLATVQHVKLASSQSAHHYDDRPPSFFNFMIPSLSTCCLLLPFYL